MYLIKYKHQTPKDAITRLRHINRSNRNISALTNRHFVGVLIYNNNNHASNITNNLLQKEDDHEDFQCNICGSLLLEMCIDHHKHTTCDLVVHTKKLCAFAPRIPNTPNSHCAGSYLFSTLKDIGMTNVWKHRWEEKIDGKTCSFTNICASFSQENTTNHLVTFPVFGPLLLAAHYDSLSTLTLPFEGAVDAAASCAVVLQIATRLVKECRHNTTSPSFHVVFFDAEEAFDGNGMHPKTWDVFKNSIRGSKVFVRDTLPNLHPRPHTLILFDLLGAPDARSVVCTLDSSKTLFKHIQDAEVAWRGGGLPFLLQTEKNTNVSVSIEDDQLPFVGYIKDIVHLIPRRFPDCWHTEKDNVSFNKNIDWAALRDWVCVIYTAILNNNKK